LRGDAHGGCGRRLGETHRRKRRQGAPGRPHLVPTRDHSVAEQSKNYRYSTAHQVVIDADTSRVVVVGRPVPGNRHDSRGWEESGAKAAVGNTMTIADGGYQGTGLVIPHRRRTGEELPSWKEQHNRAHQQIRARVEHVFARMKGWKILRDCRLKGVGVHHAMLGIARLHNRVCQFNGPVSLSVVTERAVIREGCDGGAG